MTTYFFRLSGMECASCAGTITTALGDNARIDFPTSTLLVDVEEDGRTANEVRAAIIQKVIDVGFECEDLSQLESQKNKARSHWLRGLIGITSGIFFMLMPMIGVVLPIATVAILNTAITIFLGIGSYRQAYRDVFQTQQLTMDSLFALSTITVLIVSFAAIAFPALPMMFDAALFIFGFHHCGLALKNSIEKAAGFDRQFQDKLPQQVNIFKNNATELTELKKIKPGEVMIIYPGQIIPLDGVNQNECEVIDQSFGQADPLHVKEGSELISGAYLSKDSQPLYLKVSRNWRESYLAKYDTKITIARADKPPLINRIDALLQYFIPGVILIAICTFCGVCMFCPIAFAIKCAVAVLVSACPCTLGLIPSLLVKIGFDKAANHSALFKNGAALEKAVLVDRVVFDLNGTLTTGISEVVKCEVLDSENLSTDKLIALSLALEKNSTHRIASSLRRYAGANHADDCVAEAEEHTQHGVQGIIQGEQYYLGNQKFMESVGISIDAVKIPGQHIFDKNIFLARNNKIIGYIVLRDPLRDDAREVIAKLKELGKEVYLCTGSERSVASNYALALGISLNNVRAECTVDDKKSFLKILKENGKHVVAMSGDGPNDTLAVAESDFGFAIRSKNAESLTQQAASVVIHGESLYPIIAAFESAHKTMQQINQCLFLTFCYNALTLIPASGLLMFMGISLSPLGGMVLMALQAPFMMLKARGFMQEELTFSKSPNVRESWNTMQKIMPANVPSLSSDSNLDHGIHESPRFSYSNAYGARQPKDSLNMDGNSFSKSF